MRQYLHALELRGELGAGQLELFDDVGDLLEAVRVAVRAPLAVRHHQERGALEQQDLRPHTLLASRLTCLDVPKAARWTHETTGKDTGSTLA